MISSNINDSLVLFFDKRIFLFEHLNNFRTVLFQEKSSSNKFIILSLSIAIEYFFIIELTDNDPVFMTKSKLSKYILTLNLTSLPDFSSYIMNTKFDLKII